MSTTDTPVIGYKLREDAEFEGGVIDIGRPESFDVAAALEEGNGVIVIDATDTAAAWHLDNYPPLERVAVEDDAEVLAALRKELEARTVADLRELVETVERDRGPPVDVKEPGNKPELIDALVHVYTTEQ